MHSTLRDTSTPCLGRGKKIPRTKNNMNTNISKIFLLTSIIFISFNYSCSSDSNNPTDDDSGGSSNVDDPIDTPAESAIEFEKHYQTNDSTFVFNSIVQLADSSYTLGGKVIVHGLVDPNKNVIAKLDKYGNRDWTRTMQNTYTPYGIEKLFLNNDGYLGLRSKRYSSDNSANLIFFDEIGNVESQIFFENNGFYHDMIREGNNYFVGGRIGSDLTYRMLNSNGEVIWQAIQPINTSAFSVTKLTDGNYLGIGGGNFSTNDGFLAKIDNLGNFIWIKNHRGLKVLGISDNEFLAVINDNSTSVANLARFNQDGDIIWSISLTDFFSLGEPPNALNLMTYDNGLIVCTYYNQSLGLNIIVVDMEGNLVNLSTVSSSDGRLFRGVSKTIDNGMLIVASDYLRFDIIKLSSEDIFN